MMRPTACRTFTALLSFLLLLIVVGAPGVAQAQPVFQSEADLRDYLDLTLEADTFQNAYWSALILNLNSGEVLYERNAEKSFVPASNAKIYTVASALDQLGADYRYETRVYADGPIVDGTLEGNLIVRGAGDPTIGGYEQEDNPTEIFEEWARTLRSAGITHIEGDIVGDDDLFDDTPLGAGWNWDDEPYYYAAEVGGLVFNQNTVDFEVEAQEPGMPATISWEPYDTDYVKVINSTTTVPADADDDEGFIRKRGTNTIHVTSRIREGRTEEESISITNPTLFFTHVLREALLRGGISVGGRPVDVDDLSLKPDYDSEKMQEVASYTSIPLSEIAVTLMQESHNLYAEQVLRTLGAEHPVSDPDEEDIEPGSAEMGVEAAMRTFAEAGVDTSVVELNDGSGLSRYNLVTPTTTAALLRYMWEHPDEEVRDAFLESLPTGGRNGTLEHRFRRGPAHDNVRAKTGTLSNVSALSGYVTSAEGTSFLFVLMCNNHTAKTRRVRDAQNDVVEALAASEL